MQNYFFTIGNEIIQYKNMLTFFTRGSEPCFFYNKNEKWLERLFDRLDQKNIYKREEYYYENKLFKK